MGASARDRILDAAERRLLDRGPRGLVLGAVARDAGVSKGGLLYHFSSKDDLVAGLTGRMLDRFDEVQDGLAAADDRRTGAWTRAYVGSTVTDAGAAADNSAQLMAALLALLGRDSPHLDAVRARFGRWQERLCADGLDPTVATLARLAADGLWLSSLLGLPALDPATGRRVVEALRRLTRPEPS